MPLNIPAGYVQANFKHQQNATLKVAITTIGLHTVDHAEFQTVSDSWKSNVVPEIAADYTYIGVDYVTGVGLLWSINDSEVGGDTDPGMTSQVAYLVKKQTLIAGREFRGRMYIPGCTETAVDSAGRVQPAKIASLDLAVGGFLADLGMLANPGGFLFHTAVPVLPTAIDALTTETSVATQKRRLRR